MARLHCFAALFLLCLSLYVHGAHMVGGYMAANADSPAVKKCAAFATDEINKQINSLAFYGVVKVENVERQLVNGFNFKMDLNLQPTVCRKNQKESITRGECPVAVGGETEGLHCKVVVYASFDGVPLKVTKKNCSSMFNQ